METMQIPVIVAIISFSIAGFMVNLISLKQESLVKLVPIFSYGVLLASAILIVIRGMITKSLPLTNGAEFAMWIVFMVTLMYVIVAKKFELFNLGLIIFPIIAVLGIWLEGRSTNISALAPALNSSWLKFHVFTAIVAYGAFAISFALAVMYLSRSKSSALKARFSDEKKLDDLSYRLILIGLPMHTVMIITGAVWAEYAWGTFWSWDPKETWALITWLIYAAFLHMRLQGWQGKKAAWLNIIGFLAVVFTFFGVSYLLPGLHSYI
jgi:cytochrome c-type biogenesis protein CcsB